MQTNWKNDFKLRIIDMILILSLLQMTYSIRMSDHEDFHDVKEQSSFTNSGEIIYNQGDRGEMEKTETVDIRKSETKEPKRKRSKRLKSLFEDENFDELRRKGSQFH